MKGKKGEIGGPEILVGIFVLTLIIFLITVSIHYMETNDFGSALDTTSGNFGTFFEKILIPLFNTLLNLDQITDYKLLAVLTFILLSVVLVGTLDTVDIFGKDDKGRVINLVIGVIMSIIATRYMPGDLWSSLTSPTVALIPTMLVALPFAALILLSIKIKNPLGLKILWLGYVLFMGYLTFFVGEWGIAGGLANGGMKIIYLIFFGLSILMFSFDHQVRKFLRLEYEKAKSEEFVTSREFRNRLDYKKQIAELTALKKDADSTEITEIDKQITLLRQKIRQSIK